MTTPEELELKVDALEKQLASIQASAPQWPNEFAAIKSRIGELLTQIENAQRKADDEALRAFNAKQACEEHSKSTAATRGRVDAEAAAIQAIKTKCEETERALSTGRTAADEATKGIATSREALAKAEAWVTQNLPQLEANAQAVITGKGSVDTLNAQAQTAVTAAQKAQTVAEQAQAKANGHLSTITQVRSDAEALMAKADAAKIATEASRTAAEEGMGEIKSLIADLIKKHEEVSKLRDALDALLKENKELNVKAETLLPHAASAGLASAFREQKGRFKRPQFWWLVVFIATLVLLLLIGVPEFWHEVFGNAKPSDDTLSWDSLLRHIVRRLPLVLPLVWLAVYSGRNYSMSVRLEEDYAYKEAVSTAFEGYRREMEKVKGLEDESKALHTLCLNVLAVLNQRPGRIYEGEHYDPTPFTPLATAVERLVKQLGDKDTKAAEVEEKA